MITMADNESRLKASYIIVCRKRKQFVDPLALTSCRSFENFSVFDNISRALLLLTHHNNNPESFEPSKKIHRLVGWWADCPVVTTCEHHNGKDLTGNMKLGNLWQAASKRFEDITPRVVKMLSRYELFTKGKLEIGDGKEEDLPDEVEEVNGVRFTTKYNGGKRSTIIEEKITTESGEEGWVKTGFFDEDDSE